MRRAVLGSKDMELIRLYSDIPEFRQRLHREVIDETYPKLHELLRPLSQEDIDTALCAWNGNIESKHCLLYTSSYAVCKYFGIETGENSFGYIASWSQGKELKELRASLETINIQVGDCRGAA